jgi:hypothetical protein
LKDLIRAAVALNLKGKSKPKTRRASGSLLPSGKSFGTRLVRQAVRDWPNWPPQTAQKS